MLEMCLKSGVSIYKVEMFQDCDWQFKQLDTYTLNLEKCRINIWVYYIKMYIKISNKVFHSHFILLYIIHKLFNIKIVNNHFS